MKEIETLRAEYAPEVEGLLSDLQCMPAEDRLDYLREKFDISAADVAELVKRINYILYFTPDREQYHAYVCITEAESGLHLAYDADDRAMFDRMLKCIPAENRIAEFMRVNNQNIPFIVRCINVSGNQVDRSNYYLWQLVSSSTTPQLWDLLNQRGIGGVLNLSIFSVAMYNPNLIVYLTERLTSEQLFELCTSRYSDYAPARHAMLVGLVKDGWIRHPAIQQTVHAILSNFSYPLRRKLIYHQGESGLSLFEWQEPNFGYREMIEEGLSQVFAIEALLYDYREQIKENMNEMANIESSLQLFKHLQRVELAGVLDTLTGLNAASGVDIFLENFETLLLGRLQLRFQSIGTESLRYSTQVKTLTNELIYNLLITLFDIQHLAGLIQLMSGNLIGIWQQMVIDIQDTCPEGLLATQKLHFFRHSKPMPVRFTGLESLTTLPPTLEALSMLVFSRADGVVLNLDTIKHYSFTQQRYIYKMLHANFPDLAKRVYQHNEAWRVLAEDIRYVEKAGITPKEAIRRLVKGLRRGGENYSGDEFEAGDAAFDAITKFLAYFHRLPLALQKQLLALNTSDKSKNVESLLSLLHNDQCVEMLATDFEDIYYSHDEQACMNVVVGISHDDLAAMEAKCTRGLDVMQASDMLHGDVPVALGEKMLNALTFDNIAQTFDYFSTIPNELFDLFLRTVHIEDHASFMIKTFAAVDAGYFSGERRDILLASIFKYYDHFNQAGQQVIFQNFQALLVHELRMKTVLLPFLTREQLTQLLMLQSTLPRDFEQRLIYLLIEQQQDCLIVLLDQLKNQQAFCELIECMITVDGTVLPVLFAFALCWTGHFDLLMTRFKEDESLVDYQPRLKALFQAETINQVLEVMTVKHPHIYLTRIDTFKYVVQQWINTSLIEQEEPRALKFH